jgi:hypothetical protein
LFGGHTALLEHWSSPDRAANLSAQAGLSSGWVIAGFAKRVNESPSNQVLQRMQPGQDAAKGDGAGEGDQQDQSDPGDGA